MQLREYITSDCEQLAKLFFQTVHSVNAKDYTKEQLDVWATGTVDLKEWDKSFLNHLTIVAIENNEIVGFGDIDESGYLDRLFVHREHQSLYAFPHSTMESRIGFHSFWLSAVSTEQTLKTRNKYC